MKASHLRHLQKWVNYDFNEKLFLEQFIMSPRFKKFGQGKKKAIEDYREELMKEAKELKLVKNVPKKDPKRPK